MDHAADDAEETKTKGDLEEGPEHARGVGVVLLADSLVEELALGEQLAIPGLVALLDELQGFLGARILLEAVHGGAEL